MVWRTCVECPNYEVSSAGNVRHRSSRRVPKRRLRFHPNGYVYVTLYKNGKRSSFRVHRLVASAFLGPCPGGMETNHKDGNKRNNGASNLEYTDRKTNLLHASALGLFGGIHHAHTKLTLAQVRFVKATKGLGRPYGCKNLSKKFGVTPNTISAIRRGRSWRHV